MKKTRVSRDIGTWDSLSNTIHLVNPILWERRANLAGIVLKNVVIHFDPLTILVKNNNSCISEVTGFFGEVYKILEQRLNFTSEFSEPIAGPDVYGNLDSDGNWIGAVGELNEERPKSEPFCINNACIN